MAAEQSLPRSSQTGHSFQPFLLSSDEPGENPVVVTWECHVLPETIKQQIQRLSLVLLDAPLLSELPGLVNDSIPMFFQAAPGMLVGVLVDDVRRLQPVFHVVILRGSRKERRVPDSEDQQRRRVFRFGNNQVN